MPAFNADAYLAAIERPSVVLDGVTYEGQVLSLLQFQPYYERFKAVEDGSSAEDSMAVIQDFLYALYPKPFIPWKRDIVPALLNHPALSELVKSFFLTQVAALSGTHDDHLTTGTAPQTPALTNPQGNDGHPQ